MDAKWVTQLTDSKKERVDTITFPYQVVSFVFHISIHATTIYYIAQNGNLGELWDICFSLTSTAYPTSSHSKSPSPNMVKYIPFSPSKATSLVHYQIFSTIFNSLLVDIPLYISNLSM